MRFPRSSLLTFGAVLLAFSSITIGTPRAKRQKPPAQQPKKTLEPRLPVVQGVPLRRTRFALGFSIELPVGAKAYPCRADQCSFGHYWGQYYLSVAVRRLPQRTTLKSFIHDTLRLRDESAIERKQQLADGSFLIVMRAEGRLLRSQIVHMLVPGGPSSMLRATCSSSPDVLPLMERVCRSLSSSPTHPAPKSSRKR